LTLAALKAFKRPYPKYFALTALSLDKFEVKTQTCAVNYVVRSGFACMEGLYSAVIISEFPRENYSDQVRNKVNHRNFLDLWSKP